MNIFHSIKIDLDIKGGIRGFEEGRRRGTGRHPAIVRKAGSMPGIVIPRPMADCGFRTGPT